MKKQGTRNNCPRCSQPAQDAVLVTQPGQDLSRPPARTVWPDWQTLRSDSVNTITAVQQRRELPSASVSSSDASNSQLRDGLSSVANPESTNTEQDRPRRQVFTYPSRSGGTEISVTSPASDSPTIPSSHHPEAFSSQSSSQHEGIETGELAAEGSTRSNNTTIRTKRSPATDTIQPKPTKAISAELSASRAAYVYPPDFQREKDKHQYKPPVAQGNTGHKVNRTSTMGLIAPKSDASRPANRFQPTSKGVDPPSQPAVSLQSKINSGTSETVKSADDTRLPLDPGTESHPSRSEPGLAPAIAVDTPRQALAHAREDKGRDAVEPSTILKKAILSPVAPSTKSHLKQTRLSFKCGSLKYDHSQVSAAGSCPQNIMERSTILRQDGTLSTVFGYVGKLFTGAATCLSLLILEDPKGTLLQVFRSEIPSSSVLSPSLHIFRALSEAQNCDCV